MAPGSKSDTHGSGWRTAGKVTQKFSKLIQRVDKAGFVPNRTSRSSRHDDPRTKALSLEEISGKFQRCMNDVSKSRQVLRSVFNIKNGINITRCICLGLGSFGVDPAAQGAPPLSELDRSLHQLAVLTTILQILNDRHSIREVFFQDPAFVPTEKAFLQSLGYKVLEDPAAFQKMSSSTFLFAPFLGYPVAADALAVAFPALYIGNHPNGYLESLRAVNTGPEEDASVFPGWISTFRRFRDATVVGEPLPKFDQQRCWTQGTTVHWLSPAIAEASK